MNYYYGEAKCLRSKNISFEFCCICARISTYSTKEKRRTNLAERSLWTVHSKPHIVFINGRTVLTKWWYPHSNLAFRTMFSSFIDHVHHFTSHSCSLLLTFRNCGNSYKLSLSLSPALFKFSKISKFWGNFVKLMNWFSFEAVCGTSRFLQNKWNYLKIHWPNPMKTSIDEFNSWSNHY